MDDIRFYDGDYYDWVPDGEYKAVCVDHSKAVPYRGTQKVFLTFELQTEPFKGKRLFMALNVPFSGVRPGSRYFKYWTSANGDRPPSRNAIMSPRIFKNKDFKVTTRTVKPKRREEEMPFEFWYSVVDHIQRLNLPDTQNA